MVISRMDRISRGRPPAQAQHSVVTAFRRQSIPNDADRDHPQRRFSGELNRNRRIVDRGNIVRSPEVKAGMTGRQNTIVSGGSLQEGQAKTKQS